MPRRTTTGRHLQPYVSRVRAQTGCRAGMGANRQSSGARVGALRFVPLWRTASLNAMRSASAAQASSRPHLYKRARGLQKPKTRACPGAGPRVENTWQGGKVPTAGSSRWPEGTWTLRRAWVVCGSVANTQLRVRKLRYLNRLLRIRCLPRPDELANTLAFATRSVRRFESTGRSAVL